MRHDIRLISSQFKIFGDFVSAEPYGTGHINDTYLAIYNQGGAVGRYIHQRINHGVFRNPVGVMENIVRVTQHVQRKLTGCGVQDLSRRVLTLIPTHSQLPYYLDPAGNYWRTYVFVEGAQSYDAVKNVEQAYRVAYAFGFFQKMLEDFPPPRLHETIPDFHNTPKRFAAFEKAIEADRCNRAKSASREIEFVFERKKITELLIGLQKGGEILERVTHNDTKLNNVLIDNKSGEGLCIIDLDTVMPGLSLYDFGDMVRTTTSPALEDEKDLSKVYMQMPMFEALAKGYLTAIGDSLTKTERKYLAFSGKLITFEIGIRFLTDYLEGDIYFTVHRDGHNLDRCRTQFKLVESIEQQEERMNRLVDTLFQ